MNKHCDVYPKAENISILFKIQFAISERHYLDDGRRSYVSGVALFRIFITTIKIDGAIAITDDRRA